MDRERELDNLNIMRENGLISEETYQAQRHALLGTSMVNTKLEQAKKRLQPLSLLNAFKFSFRPSVFIANFVFLFTMVMLFLIAFIILHSFLENLLSSFVLVHRSSFIQGVGFIVGRVFSVVAIFWVAVWIAFFSRLALERLERDFPPFKWSTFIKRSLALGNLSLVFLLIFKGVFVGFDHGVEWLQQWTFIPWKQYTIGISLLVVFIAIAFGMFYVQIAAMSACVGSVKYWRQTVAKALKSPLLILFAFGCVVLNAVIMFLFEKGLKYVSEPVIKTIVSAVDSIVDISGLGVIGVYLVLGIISFAVYIVLPRRGKFWFKMSFLFVIPSLVILISIHSLVFSFSSQPVSLSVYLAYFLVMHFLWGMFYVTTFFLIQSMAFLAHILTQVWCHVTHDKAGNFLFQSPEDKKQIDMPQPKEEEEEYQVPEVFR